VTAAIEVEFHELQFLTDVVWWRESLVVLAVRRSAPLLAGAGVPRAVAREPETLIETARWMVGRIDAQLPGLGINAPGGAEALDPQVVSAIAGDLTAGLKRLVDRYGRTSTTAFGQWLLRNELDWDLRNENRRWWTWMTRVLRGELEPPVSVESAARVRHLVEAFVREESAPWHAKREAEAAAIPLDGEEEQLLRYEPVHDDEESSRDVIAALGVARTFEIAASFAEVLRIGLDDNDWTAILRGLE
jgi:hypothetical protein